MMGLNVKPGGELGGVMQVSPEHFEIPPADAAIGGASYASSMTISIAALAGLSFAITALMSAPPLQQNLPVLEITIAYGDHQTTGITEDKVHVKSAYEMLREQMASEGTPFLNATELEREIAERRGMRY